MHVNIYRYMEIFNWAKIDPPFRNPDQRFC